MWWIEPLWETSVLLLVILTFVLLVFHGSGLDEEYPRIFKAIILILFSPAFITGVISSLYIIYTILCYIWSPYF